MARKVQEIHADLSPPPELPKGVVIDITQAKVSEKWVRATAILLRGRERREARMEREATESAALASYEPPVKQSPKPKIGELND